MARARAIESGDETAGVRLEFVRSRRVLRLGGWHSGNRAIAPVEVPVSGVLPRLGVGPQDLGASATYLVLAGIRDHGGEGPRHLTAAYPTEAEARDAFRALRGRHRHLDEWAEVVMLDAGCRLTRICWFGNPSNLGSPPRTRK